MGRFSLLSLSWMLLLCTSCQSQTATGAFTGGVVLAGIGGFTGGGKGALIGTTAGVIAGGLLGAILDEQDRHVMERSSPRTVDRIDRGEPLTINDVIKLSQGGISDEVIIHYIKGAGSAYHLSQTQLRRLQDAGVSQRVIQFMLDSGR